MAKCDNYSGKAYAFFNCKASADEIFTEVPTIRACAKTPKKLELALYEHLETFNFFQRDASLRVLASQAANIGRKYILEAKCPGKSNRKTADELAGILNQAYQSPLYQEGEPFTGDIAYRHRSNYVFRD